MEFNELVSFITNNGIAVVLMFYFLKNNNRSIQELVKINIELIQEIKLMREETKNIYDIVKDCNKKAS